MAFAATTEWDVRTTGNAANGGGFNVASSGTDYSQQDAAQVAYTDLVIDGTFNTKCTSSATPFTSLHVGNVINVTGGTGFTVQRVQVVSVASGVATCDKSLGTTGSTGGTGNLGGAVAALVTLLPVYANSNTIHIKAGTYSRTTSLTFTQTSVNVQIIGFSSTHRDGGTKPLLTTATNSVVLIASLPSSVWWQNISFSHTAGTRGIGISYDNLGLGIFVGCLFDGFSYCIDADFSDAGYGGVYLLACEIKNCTTKVVQSVRSIWAYDCYIHDNTGDCLGGYNGPSFVTAVRCIFATNTRGIFSDGATTNYANVQAIHCVFYKNSSDGLKTTGAAGIVMQVMCQNCVFWSNGGYGINHSTSLASTNQDLNNWLRNNAFGDNTSGARNGFLAGFGEITLTADPFTSAATGDFSLNNDAGGGALLKEAGFPGAFPGGSTGHLDVGAIQTDPAGGGGGGGSFTFIG